MLTKPGSGHCEASGKERKISGRKMDWVGLCLPGLTSALPVHPITVLVPWVEEGIPEPRISGVKVIQGHEGRNEKNNLCSSDLSDNKTQTSPGPQTWEQKWCLRLSPWHLLTNAIDINMINKLSQIPPPQKKVGIVRAKEGLNIFLGTIPSSLTHFLLIFQRSVQSLLLWEGLSWAHSLDQIPVFYPITEACTSLNSPIILLILYLFYNSLIHIWYFSSPWPSYTH